MKAWPALEPGKIQPTVRFWPKPTNCIRVSSDCFELGRDFFIIMKLCYIRPTGTFGGVSHKPPNRNLKCHLQIYLQNITPLGNVFSHVITKDMPYRDEREFRLIFWRHDLKNQHRYTICQADRPNKRWPQQARSRLSSTLIPELLAALCRKNPDRDGLNSLQPV